MNNGASMPAEMSRQEPCQQEIQELGEKEGAGRNGGSSSSSNLAQEVRLEINEDAEKKKRPSIFRPPMPIVAPTATLDGTVTASRSRGSTGGNVMIVAVGPYHGKKAPLITTEKKHAIFNFLADQTSDLEKKFRDWARKNDALVRGCYEHGTVDKITDKELEDMHLYDGCLVLFAVSLLSRLSVRPFPFLLPAEDSSKKKLEEDFTNLSADITRNMKRTRLDLLLLGNQIPFVVLQELHKQLKATFFIKAINHSLEALALACFDDIRPSPSPRRSFPKPVYHLLHLFHWSRVPQIEQATDTSDSELLFGEPESNLPCATWFDDSFIGFSKHAAAPGTLQISFQRSMLGARGVLRVPAVHIHGYSSLVFYNLIAFEQKHGRCGLGATTYSTCMARLLQSEDDARLLRSSGILAHTHETDKEIVDLFKGLAEDFGRDAFYSKDLLDLCKAVDAHHHSTAARAVKWVVLQCFPRQTVTFFVILGALISIATLVNTIFSVYRFYHPLKQ